MCYILTTSVYMKTIYLVRHAKSSWENSELPDYERPLNQRGKRDAPVMAQRFGALKLFPEGWISSPARRTWQTATIWAEHMEVPLASLVATPALYHASPEEILQVIHSQLDTQQSIILFGHNPGLTEFASLICGMDFGNIPTCGVVGVSFPIKLWKEVFFREGECLFYDYPKKERGTTN